MVVVLLMLRTALAVLSGMLVWVLMVWLVPSATPLGAVVVAGFAGGMVAMSLGPATGMQVAVTAGLVATMVAFGLAWRGIHTGNWAIDYWPLWAAPAYSAGAATWLLAARALQKQD